MAKRLPEVEFFRNSRVFGLDHGEWTAMILAHLKAQGLVHTEATVISWEYNHGFGGFYVYVDLPGGPGSPYMPDEERER